jgi:hypothetical protein
MTTDEDLGQLLRTHLAERADSRPAEGALAAVLAVTAGIRPRPSWLTRVPRGSRGARTLGGSSRRMVVALLLTVGLVVVLVLAALVAGAFRVAVAPAMPHRNGAIVVLISGGRVAVDPLTGATSALVGVTCRPGGSLCTDTQRTRRLLAFADSGASVSWSPDGTKLASQYGGAVWVFDPTASDAVRDTIRVTSADAAQASSHQPVSWSPDGSHLAFASGGEIFTVKVDGSQQTQITRFGGSAAASQPAWSPDGSRIAFRLGTNVLPPQISIATINVDGTDLQTIVGPFSGVAAPGPSPQGYVPGRIPLSPVWSPDGFRLAYLEIDAPIDTTRLITVRPDGSDQSVIFTVANCCVTDLGDVSWSPDGSRIATILIGSPPSRDWSLYVMETNGAHVVELAHHVMPGFPAWQPVP